MPSESSGQLAGADALETKRFKLMLTLGLQ